jgi:hypothetical protein
LSYYLTNEILMIMDALYYLLLLLGIVDEDGGM